MTLICHLAAILSISRAVSDCPCSETIDIGCWITPVTAVASALKRVAVLASIAGRLLKGSVSQSTEQLEGIHSDSPPTLRHDLTEFCSHRRILYDSNAEKLIGIVAVGSPPGRSIDFRPPCSLFVIVLT
jgi:hypothetical protein